MVKETTALSLTALVKPHFIFDSSPAVCDLSSADCLTHALVPSLNALRFSIPCKGDPSNNYCA